MAVNLELFMQVLPRKPNEPPVVFHWLPIVGSAVGYGNDPLNFFFKCREKVRAPIHG